MTRSAIDVIDSLLGETPAYPPLVRAKTIPRLATPIARTTPTHLSGTSISVRAYPMGLTVQSPVLGPRGETSVQCLGPSVRKAYGKPRREALADLRTLATPFSYKSAARDLGYSFYEARRWMREFVRNEWLVKGERGGHSWTDAGRLAS